MKRIIFRWILPASISILFFVNVVRPPSYFNLLPYQIHDSIWPGGEHEFEFIVCFDAIIALGIFFLVRKLSGFKK